MITPSRSRKTAGFVKLFFNKCGEIFKLLEEPMSKKKFLKTIPFNFFSVINLGIISSSRLQKLFGIWLIIVLLKRSNGLGLYSTNI